MPESADKLSEIGQIYFHAKPATIDRDIARAIAILKSMETEEERERATVFMEGLNEMRGQWKRTSGQ
jgi:hypothetical protein